MTRAVIIGGGHNGLVAAFYLARAGYKPLLLERRDEVGGGAITGEIHHGFLAPTLSHECRLERHIVREMELERHGLERFDVDQRVFAPSVDHQGLLLINDAGEDGSKGLSAKDLGALAEFRAGMSRMASILAAIFTAPPPDIDHPGARDVLNLLKAGKGFRDLGKRDGYRLLRWISMPVGDLMQEWFESELLRATIAGPALSGTRSAPRSAGSALLLLIRQAYDHLGGGLMHGRGGPGGITRALTAAARAAGVEIRTAAPVERILVERDRVRGVLVAPRQEMPADVVVSAVDPATTFLKLVDAGDLPPDFNAKIRNYRTSGTVAKVNLALAALPPFGVDADALRGRIHIGPELDYIERAFDHAKYGELSSEPWLDVRIPSILQPDLAPAGAHVASIYVHYAPRRLRNTEWDLTRTALLDRTLNVLERYAPGLRSQVVAAQVITPEMLERDYGFHGGHIFHGDLTLDQLFTMRPLLGYARYRSPIRGLYLCGAGTHPGGFMSGTSARLAAREIAKDREN